jgi:hypothetical protein
MRAPWRLAAVLAVMCGAVLPNAPAAAVELVQNGGFEDADLSSWRFRGLSYERLPSQDPSRGAYVLRISVDAANGDPQWIAQQALPYVTSGATYLFGAALAVSGGTAQARTLIEWKDGDDGFGNSILTSVTPWTTTVDGAFQAVQAQAVAPARARSALVRIEARDVASGVEVRIDAVSVDGPPPASPTPAVALAGSPSPTSSVTSTPSPSPTPTVTPTPGPGEELRNPGFEEVVDGVPVAWQKYGGELVTTTRGRSGERAGLLRSASSATKWAYQTVLVEAGEWYEFDAWVLSEDPAVERSLLRVSWYASADGSDAAISTADSTTVLDAPASNYRHLTTGPVQAPPGARSARPRILLAPAGARPASLVIDDAGWRRAAPPTATPTPAPSPASSPEATRDSSPTSGGQRAGRSRSEVLAATAAPATPSSTSAAGIGAGSVLPTPRPFETSARVPAQRGRGAPWWTWTAGAAASVASVAALTSAFALRRRRVS